MADEKLNRLRDKQKEIAEQIRREEARLNVKKRAKDTRRKILAGAFVLDRASRDDQYNGWLVKSLDGFLTRPDDRALFGLPALPPATDTVPAPAAIEDSKEP
jgi:hypothetical protein